MTANSGDSPSTTPENKSRNREVDSGLGDIVHSDRDFANIDEFRFSHPDLKIADGKVLFDLEHMYNIFVKNGRTMDALDEWIERIASTPHTEEEQKAFAVLKLYQKYLEILTQQGMVDEEKAEAYFRTHNSPAATVDIGEIEAVPLPRSELTDAVMAAKAIEASDPEEGATWTEADTFLYRAAVEVNEADSDRRGDIDRLKSKLPRKYVRRVEEAPGVPFEPGDTGRHAQRRTKH
jgi:hypothetical protein